MDYLGGVIVFFGLIRPEILGDIAARIKRGYIKKIADQERENR